MTTNDKEIEELLDVLEGIRSKQYPEIPAELIKNLVYNEFDKQDDRVKAQKTAKKLMDDYLKTVEEA